MSATRKRPDRTKAPMPKATRTPTALRRAAGVAGAAAPPAKATAAPPDEALVRDMLGQAGPGPGADLLAACEAFHAAHREMKAGRGDTPEHEAASGPGHRRLVRRHRHRQGDPGTHAGRAAGQGPRRLHSAA